MNCTTVCICWVVLPHQAKEQLEGVWTHVLGFVDEKRVAAGRKGSDGAQCQHLRCFVVVVERLCLPMSDAGFDAHLVENIEHVKQVNVLPREVPLAALLAPGLVHRRLDEPFQGLVGEHHPDSKSLPRVRGLHRLHEPVAEHDGLSAAGYPTHESRLAVEGVPAKALLLVGKNRPELLPLLDLCAE